MKMKNLDVATRVVTLWAVLVTGEMDKNFGVTATTTTTPLNSPNLWGHKQQSKNNPFLKRRNIPHWMGRGGGSSGRLEGTSKVSVSPNTELPGSFADVSLVAFTAPVPVPTTNDDGDDYSNDEEVIVEEEAEPSGEDEDVEGQASIPQVQLDKKSTSGGMSAKLQNVKERTGPAILMLAAVGLWSYYLKEDGLILLTLALQVGMYKEMTYVIGGDFPHTFYKWWWFLTASLSFNLPRMFPWADTTITTITYGMSVLGTIMTIVGFNWNEATVDEFREYLRQAAVSFLSALLVIAPSSFWIATLEEFGMVWILYSVVLVIINDTMAYFFGITMGRHPLLPTISPKKTWEGFLGAALSTSLVGMYWLPTKRDGLVISAFASIAGPFGGFMASLIKRAYNQKDFGALFPGHGGLVDRLDCQVFLAPFIYLYLAFSRNSEESISELLTNMADSLIS